ncbi:MAG: LemA family protein [Dokdonella sp.]
MRLMRLLILLLLPALLGGCGYNKIQRADEDVKAQTSEVINQYKRRADLVPMLVNAVTGFAKQEQEVLIRVTEARARVGSIQATPELVDDAAAMAKFQAAQGELSSALSRLLVVTENYPELKSDQGFRDLQAQLEGTENRIAVARNRLVQSIQAYNVLIREFPVNLTAKMFGYPVKANFTVENVEEITKPPVVDFSGLSSRPAAQPAPVTNKQTPAETPPVKEN